MHVAKIVYLGMTVATFVVLLFRAGWPRDLEEMCTMVGASVIWFIVWPADIVQAVQERMWRKAYEKKHRIDELRWSIEDFGKELHSEDDVAEINERYGITCDGHVDADCTSKRRQRIVVLERLEGKPWVEQ